MRYSALLGIAFLSCSYAQAEDMYASIRGQSARQALSDQQRYSPRAIGIVDGPAARNAASASFAFGHMLPGNSRIELEYTTPASAEFSTRWRWTGGLSQNVIQTSSQRLMFNAYKDFPLTDVVSLYGGAGVGLARVRAGGYQGNTSRRFESNTKNNFAYGLTVGADFRLNQTWSLGAGYRYVSLGKATTGLNNFANASGRRDERHEGKLSEQNLFAELRMRF